MIQLNDDPRQIAPTCLQNVNARLNLPMRTGLRALASSAVLTILFLVAGPASSSSWPVRAQQTQRTTPPSEDEQKKVEKVIKDTYKTEYQRTAPVDQVALAQRLLKEGLDTKGDSSTQYVLLREARVIAARGGDVTTAVNAATETARAFDVDELKLKTDTWDLLGRSSIGTQSPKVVAENYASLSQAAVVMDRYDEAFTIAKKAETFAKDPKMARFLAGIQQQGIRATELLKAYQTQKVKPAVETLRSQPEDADANATVGRFCCFDKLDWERGLPLLRKGPDSPLKNLAERELAKPDDPAEQVSLADEWWALSTKESNPTRKKAMQARAVSWYELAETKLSGPAKEKVQKRVLQYLTSQNAVDLLKLLNTQGGVGGDWTFVGGALVSPKVAGIHSLPIPYEPPEEYDLIIVTERKAGWQLCACLAFPGGQVVALLSEKGACFDQFNAGPNNPGAPTPFPKLFAQDRPSRIVCHVRRFSIVITADNATVLGWYGNFDPFGMNPYRNIPNPRAVYIGVEGATFHTTKITLIPVTGTGKSLR